MTPIAQAPFAAIQAAASAGRGNAILYMPAGRWQITPWIGGQPAPLDVLVEPQAAEAIEAQRRIQATGGARAFFSPSHQSSQPWFEVDGFAWETRTDKSGQPHTGIWASGSFTEAGTRGMAANVFPYFSPEFFVDNLTGKPARVVTNPKARANMGGFVDQPAFPMPPVQAAGAVTSAPAAAGSVSSSNVTNQQQTDPMKKSWLLLDPHPADGGTATAPAAPVQAAAAPAAAPAPAPVQAAASPSPAELAELKLLREADTARREREADAAVAVCCSKGIIPPKDEAAKKQWRADFVANPALATRMTALPAALPQGRIVQAAAASVTITKEDTNAVLAAYAAEPDPMVRGRIYAAELDPILAKGQRIAFERLPVQAANSLGTLVGDIVSQRTLATLASRRPMLLNVVTDFSNEQAFLDQSVKTRTIGLPTVGNFGAAASDRADTDYTVTLSAHKQVQFSLTAANYNSTGRDLVREHSDAMALALGNHMVDAVAALITDAFTSETTGAGSTKNYTDVTAATKALNAAGAPDMERFMWVNSDFAEALRNDETVMENWDKQNTSGYARWKNIHGFGEINEYPALPGNSVNLIGFGFQRNALLLASRVAINPQDLLGAGYAGTLKVVQDPISGLAVVSNQWITQDTLALNDRLILLYGVARGIVAAGHKFVTS